VVVLDENLNDPQIASDIRDWYRGRVCVVNELRPSTLIKDDAIPTLLRAHSGCLFVTQDPDDFWKRFPSDPSYCVIGLSAGFPVTHTSPLVRAVLRLSGFRTRRERVGKIARVTQGKVEYYTHWSATVVSLGLRIE
jgi:hypothetical protein